MSKQTDEYLKGHEYQNKEISLFDIIQFLIRSRIFLFFGLCLGLIVSSFYTVYVLLQTPISTATITIPVKVKSSNEELPNYSLSTNDANPLFNYDYSQLKSKTKDFNDDLPQYFYKELNLNNTDSNRILVSSLNFISTLSGHAIVAKVNFKTQALDKLPSIILNSVNDAVEKFNKNLITSMGENHKLTKSNNINLIHLKNKLTLDLFKTQIQLKKIILPLQIKLGAKSMPIVNNNTLYTTPQTMEQQQNFILQNNFKDTIAQLELQNKITPTQAEESIAEFLRLIHLVETQESKLSSFLKNKFLPIFEETEISTIEIEKQSMSNIYKKIALFFLAALILGGLAGICTSILVNFFRENKHKLFLQS